MCLADSNDAVKQWEDGVVKDVENLFPRTLVREAVNGTVLFGHDKHLPSLVIEPFGRFNPRDDMTPVEAAHIAVLLAHGCIQNVQHDFQTYVRMHGLQRHFGTHV